MAVSLNRSIVVAATVFAVVPVVDAQTIRHVRREAPACGNGASWTTAYNDLQPALDWVTGQSPSSSNPFEIWIAKGTYHPHDKQNGSIAFPIPTHVVLLGGFIGNETDPNDRDPVANLTVLHGVITPTCLVPCPDIMEDQPAPCCGDPDSGSCLSPHGAPGCKEEVCCASVCATSPDCCDTAWTDHCVTLANLYCGPNEPGWGTPGGDPPYYSMSFSASVVGGIDAGSGRYIDGFTVTEGGWEALGVSTASGGGVSLTQGELEVVRCRDIDNQAEQGGGIAVGPLATKLTVWNSQIVQNRAESNGGAVFATHPYDIFNSIVARNGLGNCIPGGDPGACPTGEGGGIYDQMLPLGASGLVRRLVNCTITQNIGGFHSGFMQFGAPVGDTALRMVNTIIYHNEVEVSLDPNCSLPSPPAFCPTEYRGQAVFTACDVNAPPGSPPYPGTIDKEPKFKSLDPAAADYRLKDLSPCLNAGNEDPANVPMDLRDVNQNGNTMNELDPDVDILLRKSIGPVADCARIDIGAHESQTGPPCFVRDLNQDCQVDGGDLGIFLTYWGCTGPGDFDCSASVDGGDLGLLLTVWGPVGAPCCGEGMMAGMGGAEGDEALGEDEEELTPELLAAALGFSSIDELSQWLGEQSYETMVGMLDLLGG